MAALDLILEALNDIKTLKTSYENQLHSLPNINLRPSIIANSKKLMENMVTENKLSKLNKIEKNLIQAKNMLEK